MAGNQDFIWQARLLAAAHAAGGTPSTAAAPPGSHKWDTSTSKCCSETLCPTSTSKRRSLQVTAVTTLKCCPDQGTGQTCKFATGSAVGVCCTTALWVQNQCCTSPKKVCGTNCCDLCDSTDPNSCCPAGRTVCNGVCCAADKKGCSASNQCVQCDADNDCTGGQICCNNQCVTANTNTFCGSCNPCPSTKQCTNTGTASAPAYKCRCKKATGYTAQCDATNACSQTPNRQLCNLDTCQCQQCSQTPADVYFMSDNTGTMTNYIQTTQTGANSILSALDASVGALRTGGGAYRDKSTSYNSNTAAEQKYGLYKNWADLADGSTAGAFAINKWEAYGNSAGLREAQLFGLYKVATQVNGWRTDAVKVLVWFGDYPGHEPICTTYEGNDEGISITLDLVVQKLKDKGIKVIAISVGDNLLNSQTTTDGNTGNTGCGEPNTLPFPQATTITAATGGMFMQGITTSTIVQAIKDALYATTCSNIGPTD